MNTTSFAIQGELTVFTAHELKARLLATMAQDATLEIHLDELSEFDGAGLQLLLATQHEAQQRGGQLTLSAIPPQVASALQLTGLLHQFNTPVAKALEVTP